MSQECSKCGLLKGFDDFPKNERRCKQCMSEKYREWSQKNKSARRKSQLRYSRSEKGKENSRRAGKIYRQTHERLKTHKDRARAKVLYAVKMGYLERKPCVVCGDPKSQGHHEDYSKPLDVVWLCARHHTEVHNS